MDISEEIKSINLTEHYQREIFGLGEIYELASAEYLRKKLLKKYNTGQLFLASNKTHSGRGVTLEDLVNYLTNQRLNIRKKGYLDSPPWSSAPLGKEKKKDYNKIIIYFVKLIFFILVRMEFLWRGEKRSHMVYVLIKE